MLGGDPANARTQLQQEAVKGKTEPVAGTPIVFAWCLESRTAAERGTDVAVWQLLPATLLFQDGQKFDNSDQKTPQSSCLWTQSLPHLGVFSPKEVICGSNIV